MAQLTTGGPAAAVAPVEAIRADFPALERTHLGRPVAYFDGPGGTQVPRQVAEAMTDYLLHHNANTHWVYPTSVETDQLILEARAAVADFLNCSPGEVAFGANMTTLTFHVARALGRQWGPGDEVVVTELDHQANVAPWLAVARERGVTVRTVRMLPESGTLDWADFEAKVNGRTRLVAIGVASNALGTVNDVARARELARTVGVLVYMDAVHAAAHLPLDVRALGCDFLACSSYKFYGPHMGILYGRADRLRALDVPKLDPAPDTVPERVETGTLSHEGIHGVRATIDWIAGLAEGGSRRERVVTAMRTLEARSDRLFAQLWDGLGAVKGVRRFGLPPGGSRTSTLAFAVDGVPSTEVAARLADRALFISNGDFYATTAVERLGYGREGLVRVGMACYTTADEVARVVDGVREIIRNSN